MNAFFSTFPENANLTWSPADFQDDQDLPVQPEGMAADAWRTISQQLPELGHLMQNITPKSLVDNLLIVTVSDPYTYAVLTRGQRIRVDLAARDVLGSEAVVQVEMTQRDMGAA